MTVFDVVCIMAGMTNPTLTVAARLPRELVARLDAFADGRAEPGLRLSRSDAVRMLVTRALDALAAEAAALPAPTYADAMAASEAAGRAGDARERRAPKPSRRRVKSA